MKFRISAMAGAVAMFAAGAMAQFGPGLPQPGDKLPDLTIYDDQGEEFQLRRLQGEHSVIVFGCLT
mgnify:FL=1